MEIPILSMQMRDYRALLMSRHQAAIMGIPAMEPWPPDRAARLMAILQVFGNNEGFTLSSKFNADRDYIQFLYHLNGGEMPGLDFARHLREWVSTYSAVTSDTDPTFVEAREWIRQRYDFILHV